MDKLTKPKHTNAKANLEQRNFANFPIPSSPPQSPLPSTTISSSPFPPTTPLFFFNRESLGMRITLIPSPSSILWFYHRHWPPKFLLTRNQLHIDPAPNPPTPTGCYGRGLPGHWSRDCPSNPNSNPNEDASKTTSSHSIKTGAGGGPGSSNPPVQKSTEMPKKDPRTRPKLTPDLCLQISIRSPF